MAVFAYFIHENVFKGQRVYGLQLLPIRVWPKTGRPWMADVLAVVTEEDVHADGLPLAHTVILAAD